MWTDIHSGSCCLSAALIIILSLLLWFSVSPLLMNKSMLCNFQIILYSISVLVSERLFNLCNAKNTQRIDEGAPVANVTLGRGNI